ncbi:amino acid permease [Glaciimonas immobilis]|uniref:Diguanylate cyclase (GGDEF)-like protein/PAS domain S-box-containing protein n=1 Tax=Glaciimonas immobilis TaxID=728004 RepID=A0A840RQ31_9BURK|nr:amino acid permease [Glaciimonas immobilis]KAF3997018.1 amino acid permease [Glaciimonas immobilis]MBB5199855.1 diguanylate cyclase (GGDEF)-like protein/PAS domain S-box-containing protein [Glaciimonas immobilis]
MRTDRVAKLAMQNPDKPDSQSLRPSHPPSHPRTIGWFGAAALAMGGSNQSLFLLSALFIGQEAISGQGSATIPLLIGGLLLAWAAAPGWIELVLMYPNRVGGISASCVEAFRPYSPVLANLTGVCYWWGWIPTCGLTAILSASAIHAWYLPNVPVNVMAVSLVVFFTCIGLCGIKWVSRLAIPIASLSALLAFISGLAPILAGQVDWQQATTFHLTTPFPGWFGELTSLMAGLYLIGFAAPAFEAAACHVGEMVDPKKALPRAMLVSALMASVFFIFLPIVWLGTLGADSLGKDLALELGPTFAPLFGIAGKSIAVWFMMLSMFSGTLQPLAGASRTLSQLSEDGLLPRILALRSRTDTPWVATTLTAGMAILFLMIGDPIWLIAAANFTYLISIALPSVAVWLLRRDAPGMTRPYRAPRGTIALGLAAAGMWAVSALLGFEQFGLPTVLIGLAFAYSGSLLYMWRRYGDRRLAGLPGLARTLHLKLTGAMIMVMVLDGTGYLMAVTLIPYHQGGMMTALADIFVAVAMLTIGVGLVLPGMIAHSAVEISDAAKQLASGTLTELSRAMQALGRGDIDAAHASVSIMPVQARSRDEIGDMAASFNLMQYGVANVVTGLDGAREGLRQARREVTSARFKLEQRILQQQQVEEKLSGILDSIPMVVWSISAAYELLYMNPAAHVIYGRSVAEFTKDRTLWISVVHSEDRPKVKQWLAQVLVGDAQTLEYRIVRPDGEVRWLEDRARTVRDAGGNPLRLNGVATDISERRLRNERIEYLANFDPLTGLPNRNLFINRLEQSLRQARRAQSRVGLLFLDIDRFKYFNDSFGHSFGDSVLKEFALRIKSVLREEDTLARLAGDEFVILLAHIREPEDAASVSLKILNAFLEPVSAEGRELHMSASIGVSVFPEDADGADALLKHADLAMYRAKDQGRNCFQCYTLEMGAKAVERAKLEDALHHAIENNEFELYYQPQIDLENGRIKSIEALLRWRHPKLGFVAPARFIQVAEETGLIVSIGEWVLRTACAQASAWNDAGYSLTVAVNVSGRQLNQKNILDLVQSALDDAGLQAGYLELELTESILMKDSEATIKILDSLKALGVQLSIDDFGTGFSSLSYLSRFPIDIIKIDQTFIAGLATKPEAASITLAIIALARALDLKTVAEGVETAEQLDFLHVNGCDAIQGYYFSRPLPVDELTMLLRLGTKLHLGKIIDLGPCFHLIQH